MVTSFAIDSTHSVALQQDFFDKVFPNILPMAYTLLMYYFLRVKSASGAVNRRDVCSFYCLFCIRHFVNGTRHRIWRCLFTKEFHPVQTLQQVENYTALSERASEYLLAVIRRKPDAVICTATGATPLLTYHYLVEKSTSSRLMSASSPS